MAALLVGLDCAGRHRFLDQLEGHAQQDEGHEAGRHPCAQHLQRPTMALRQVQESHRSWCADEPHAASSLPDMDDLVCS